MLFSATMPPRIDAIAGRHLRDPVRIEMGRQAQATGEAPLIRQSAYLVARAHKPAALGRVLDIEAAPSAQGFQRESFDIVVPDEDVERLQTIGDVQQYLELRSSN